MRKVILILLVLSGCLVIAIQPQDTKQTFRGIGYEVEHETKNNGYCYKFSINCNR